MSGSKPRIAIVGTGLVGSGWAIVFARAGHPVALYDVVPGAAGRASGIIAERLEDLEAVGLLTESAEVVHARVEVAPSVAAALEGAVYVQESVPERVDAKTEALTEIDRFLRPDAWVGSSSSGLGASLYTAHAACKARCLVAHPLNPPYLAPIVELVPSSWTTAETMSGVKQLMESVGQSPIVLTREIDGFVLNRLQAVLLMEAWRLVEQGIAGTCDIDKVVSQGLGLRWAFMGPFETIDLNAPGGVADYARRLGPLYRSIAAETTQHETWSEPLIAKVEAQRREHLAFDDLQSRMGWRDRRLMALALHKAAMDKLDDGEQSSGSSRPAPHG